MNVQLHRTSRVFISLVHNGQRFWLSDVANARATNGALFLRGDWNVDAAQARAFTYETATVARRRFAEQNISTQVSLTTGDKTEFIEE